MPEINFRVKIIGGKRTDTKVFITPPLNSKTVTFRNGNICTSHEFTEKMYIAIMDHIQNEVK